MSTRLNACRSIYAVPSSASCSVFGHWFKVFFLSLTGLESGVCDEGVRQPLKGIWLTLSLLRRSKDSVIQVLRSNGPTN